MDLTLVVSRCADGDAGRTAVEDELISRCAANGVDVLVVPHLYNLTDDSKAWSAIADISGEMVVAGWIHPRPLLALLAKRDIRTDGVRAFNIGACDGTDDCVSRVAPEAAGDEGRVTEITEPARDRWYPVIDGTRCTNCGHCIQFCLFDVYTVDASGWVKVANPEQCKPGCPACSRICPHGAIIFPLYAKDDAVAGAPGAEIKQDAVAKRMYYARTKQPCPVCGKTIDLAHPKPSPGDTDLCPECGSSKGSKPEVNQTAQDDIDLLINDLERLTDRRS